MGSSLCRGTAVREEVTDLTAVGEAFHRTKDARRRSVQKPERVTVEDVHDAILTSPSISLENGSDFQRAILAEIARSEAPGSGDGEARSPAPEGWDTGTVPVPVEPTTDSSPRMRSYSSGASTGSTLVISRGLRSPAANVGAENLPKKAGTGGVESNASDSQADIGLGSFHERMNSVLIFDEDELELGMAADSDEEVEIDASPRPSVAVDQDETDTLQECLQPFITPAESKTKVAPRIPRLPLPASSINPRPVMQTCAACKFQMPRSANFCSECGAPMKKSKPANKPVKKPRTQAQIVSSAQTKGKASDDGPPPRAKMGTTNKRQIAANRTKARGLNKKRSGKKRVIRPKKSSSPTPSGGNGTTEIWPKFAKVKSRRPSVRNPRSRLLNSSSNSQGSSPSPGQRKGRSGVRSPVCTHANKNGTSSTRSTSKPPATPTPGPFSAQQRDIFAGRTLETEHILRPPITDLKSLRNVRCQVFDSLEFLRHLTKIADDLGALEGTVFQELLGRISMFQRWSSPDAADEFTQLDRSVRISGVVAFDGLSNILLSRLTKQAQDFRNIIRVKVEDDNDIARARKCLQDCVNYFETLDKWTQHEKAEDQYAMLCSLRL